MAAATAQGQLRVVNYNIAQLGGDLEAMTEVFAALNTDDRPGFATAPHVYLCQEVRNGQPSLVLAALNVAAPPGVFYELGTYTNQGEDGVAGAQAMFFRADVLDEDEDAHRDISTGAGRRTDRWRLFLKDYDADDAAFYAYSAHLKAGDDPSEAITRRNGAIAIRENADDLPEGSHIIYAGDFNFYDHLEAGYAVLREGGPGAAIDPLGIGSWSGSTQAYKHTQSPRLTTGGLIGGGMDDRFDFQLSTQAFHDGAGFSLMGGTYRPLGNDGNHYNRAINFGNNSYYPADIPRSNALADALHDSSDHIPLVVDYQLPALVDAAMTEDFGRVIRDATFEVDLAVANGAPAVTPLGADFLFYDVTASGALQGATSGVALALGAPTIIPIDVDTTAVGDVSGDVTVSSDSQGAGQTPTVLATSGTVVRPSRPSFDPAGVETEATLTWDVEPNSGTHTQSVPLANIDFDALQAQLDLDDVDDPGTPFAFDGEPVDGIGSDPVFLDFTLDTTDLAPGDYEAAVQVYTSDEDIPGAATQVLTLTLLANVSGEKSLPGDIDGDGAVDFNDLLILLASWGKCPPPPCPADIDGSGDVGFNDLLVVLAGWTA